MKRVLNHRITRLTWRTVRVAWLILGVAFAVALVTLLTVDIGPMLHGLAEEQASRYLERPMTIGRLSVRIWPGRFAIDDLRIDGLTPESRPFITAKRITVSMAWRTLLRREVTIADVDMAGWRMHVEVLDGGRHSFPKVMPDGPRNPNRTWTTTVRHVLAHDGEFAFDDRGTPWSAVARNLELTLERAEHDYRGRVGFSGGTVAISDFEPMRTDLDASFSLDAGLVAFDRMEVLTDGTRSDVTGTADLGNFPEMTYHVRSQVDFPTMREVFFADDDFSLSGEGEFTGTWHLYKGGRDLTGRFTTPLMGINDFRFADVGGALYWSADRFEVTEGVAAPYGGTARFTYTMAPLGDDTTPAVASLVTDYVDVDVSRILQAAGVTAVRPVGRATGRNRLDWPLGRFAGRSGGGRLAVVPPGGQPLQGPVAGVEHEDAAARRAQLAEPFIKDAPLGPVPVGGEIVYTFGPEWVEIEPSRLASPTTHVAFQGRTAWGEQSEIPFQVASRNWQESDRLLSGLLTAFGVPTGAVQVDGYGRFEGVMTGTFRDPRIEGDFASGALRVFDVTWGSARGHVIIEDSYADARDVVIESGDRGIRVDGRFSIGYPRRDQGEEINAQIRVTRWGVNELRRAFGLLEYPVEGTLAGEFHVFGAYENPYGFGLMSIESGVAYSEPFDLATASLRLEGNGVRLDGIEIRKGSGTGAGAAFIGFDGTYSFNFQGRRIPIETLSAAWSEARPPLTGFLDFTAGGSGLFENPSYDVKVSMSDVFLGDEGVGRIAGDLVLRDDVLNIKMEAASSRLAVSGAGRIELNDGLDADLTFVVSDTSLDPYLRVFQPRLSPFTTAIAGGKARVVGELADIERLRMDGEVDGLQLSLFDYRLRNASPVRFTVDGAELRVETLHLAGEDTELDLTGVVDLEDRLLSARASGVANLGIIQGFVRDVRSSGRASVSAEITGALESPTVTGTMTIDQGRIRHFALPHALENIDGVVRFDSRGAVLDGVRARLGGGDVVFGGRIDVAGFLPERVDVTVTGRNMRLRFPEGMRSLVDAELALAGTPDSLVLGGDVLVRSALYSQRFDTGGGVIDFTGGAEVLASTATSLEPTLPIRYDVAITAPGTLRVENNSARISASADLRLEGTYERPLLFGRVDVDRGEVTFEGRRYTVTRGSVDFNNPTRIQPFFDVEADTRVRVPGQTYQITVAAAGTFDRLTPTFSADPPLPEIETIALLLGDVSPGQDVELNRYSTVITPQEQLLRERAARALTGALSAEVGRVAEQTFGVDTFQLNLSVNDLYQQSSRLTPGARLTIGKRLSDRVYLTFSRSLAAAARDQIILLEYDQSERLSWVLSQNEDDTYALEVRVRHVF